MLDATDYAPRLRTQYGTWPAARKASDLIDGGHHAMGGIPVLEPWREQQPAVGASGGRVHCRLGGVVQLDGNHHAGEYHLVVQRKHR